MKMKPDLAAFASASASQRSAPPKLNGVKHLQVRLTRADAVRLRRVAEERGQTIQAALVEAINLYFRNGNESPASDPGTGSKG